MTLGSLGAFDKAFEVFSEVIDNSENQDKLLERLAGDSPKDTAVIAVIRQYLPAASAPAFDKLIVKQLAKVEARIAGEGDLEKLVSLRAELDGSPEAQEMMNKMAPEMLERLNEAQVMKAEEIFSAAEDPVKMLGVFNMYNGILEKHPEVEAKLRERNPELVDRMIANRAEQINKYLEKLGDPGEIDMALADMEAAGLGEFRARAPQSVNARMDEDIAGRYRQLHRKRFLEQARQQAGDRFDAAEFESAFDRDLAPMFKAGEKPDQAAIDAVRAQIEERIRGEAEAGAEREKAMMEAGAPAGDMTSAPSPEDIERIRQEAMQGQIGQTAPTAPEGGSFASPTAPPPSADTTAPSPEEIERMRQEQMPSAEEIERMRQEAMRQQMEQMMPPQ